MTLARHESARAFFWIIVLSEFENDKPRGWHLERSVSLGHIITTLTIAIAAFGWANQLDKRVSENTLTIAHVAKGQGEIKTQIREDLSTINQKLDRIVERLLSGSGG